MNRDNYIHKFIKNNIFNKSYIRNCLWTLKILIILTNIYFIIIRTPNLVLILFDTFNNLSSPLFNNFNGK